MKIRNFAALALGLVMVATGGLASPVNITSGRRTDFQAPGRHLFYVWCATGKDRIAYQQGASADDAREKLRLSERDAGRPGCQPVWQGRIAS